MSDDTYYFESHRFTKTLFRLSMAYNQVFNLIAVVKWMKKVLNSVESTTNGRTVKLQFYHLTIDVE